jgi:hypothetical protein
MKFKHKEEASSILSIQSQSIGNEIRRMYWWQVGKFFRDANVRSEFVPLLYQQFALTRSLRAIA